MSYTASEISAFLTSARTNLGDLMYTIATKENLGEKTVKLHLQARVLSASILASENYNEYTPDEKSKLADLYSNYNELTKDNC